MPSTRKISLFLLVMFLIMAKLAGLTVALSVFGSAAVAFGIVFIAGTVGPPVDEDMIRENRDRRRPNSSDPPRS